MAGNEYIVPIGIDATKLINPLNEAIGTLEKVESVAKETGNELNNSFSRGSKGIESVQSKLKPLERELQMVRDAGKIAGKELAEAFNARNVNPDAFAAKVDSFAKKLNNITAKVDIDFDDSKLQIFQRQLDNTTNEIEELELQLNITKEIMATMDTNSEEYMQLAGAVEFTENAMREFSNAADLTNKNNKSLKAELRNLKAELQQLEIAGETNSARFKELSLRAGELQDQIGDTNAQIKILSSDTKYFDALISGVSGLAGAFTVVQGSAALFGGENEELQETLNKVMGSMAILQGLQQVANTLNKDSAFSVIFLRNSRVQEAEAIATETIATETNTIATEANIVATETEALAKTTVATATKTKATADIQASNASKAAATGAAANATAQGASTVAMTVSAIAARVLGVALKAIGIGLILEAVAQLIDNWDGLKESFMNLIPAGVDIYKLFDKIKSYARGLGNSILTFVIAPFKAAYQAITGDLSGALETAKKSIEFKSNFEEGKRAQDAQNREKYRLEEEQKDIESQKRAVERAKNRGEDVFKKEQDLRKRQIILNKKTGQDNIDLQKEYEDAEDKRFADNKRKSEAAAKEQEAAAKRAREKAIAEAKKRAEEEKKQNELVLKYAQEIDKKRIVGLDDSYLKEREAIKANAKIEIENLKRDGAKTLAAIGKQKELIVAINKEADDKLLELEKKTNAERLSLRLEGLKNIETLQKDSQNKALKLLDIENQETIAKIKEKYAKEKDIREKLLVEQAIFVANKQKEIAIEYGQKALKDDEERLSLGLELMQGYGKKTLEAEKQLQLGILKIRLDSANKSIELLLANGKNENDLEVLRARKLVKDIKKEIDTEAKKGNKFSLFGLLNVDLSGLTTEEAEKARATLEQVEDILTSGLEQVTQFILDKYDEQINAQQKVIDQSTKEIEDLEERLDEEKELREQGFANNYEMIQKELEAKKMQRDEEIAQQQELLAKKRELQKAQLLADSALQLSNLVTSASSIYKALAPSGVGGIALAIATIGVMLASFAATKTKAFQAINSGDDIKYAKGGWIDGNSHDNGGVKYFGNNGSVRELEGGEFVTRKSKAKKYGALLEFINSEDDGKLTFRDLENIGLLDTKKLAMNNLINDEVAENSSLKVVNNVNNFLDSRHLKSIDKNIKVLANSEKNKDEYWEDNLYFYKKVGTKITKTRK